MSKHVTIVLLILFHLQLCILKQNLRPSYKYVKKLQKPEVDVKAFLFPCSSSKKQFLNSTLGLSYKSLSNCSRKLIIRIAVNSGGEYCTKSDGFIPIDHVIDGITGRKKMLLHPLMVRIKRERMYQLYDLQLVKSVNAEAREEVLQYENTSNFIGCDNASSHPTCGYSFFKNKIIQYSEGFCCSCDQTVNDQRQPCDGHPDGRKYPSDMKVESIQNHRRKRNIRGIKAGAKKTYFSNIISVGEDDEPSVRMKRENTNISLPNDRSCIFDNSTSCDKLFARRNKLETNMPSEFTTSARIYDLYSSYLSTLEKECKRTSKNSTSTNITCSVDQANHKLSSLERIVYEIVPILNNADTGIVSDNKDVSIIFKDAENTTQNCLPKEQIKDSKSVNRIEKRETCKKQIRGGQSCSGRDVPCYAQPETYFESAHCLRFSDLWYNVHRLVNPKLENPITVKIYAKHKWTRRKACWDNLTKHVPGRIGNVNEILTDGKGGIVINYSSDDNVAYSLDCSTYFLLVPQPISEHCKNDELQCVSRGGPREYLVLEENKISFDGDECDRAGMSYAAFARQSHRCEREAGSCLKNQPLQFWREDKEAEAEGKQGQYFLSNYIKVIDQPIFLNTTSNRVILRAPYYKRYRTQIVTELNADHIGIIADRSEGQITEVYVDATMDKMVVNVVVTNMGIAADLFSVDLVNCTQPLSSTEFSNSGKAEILPQQRRTFTSTIVAPHRFQETKCQLAVYSIEKDIVASRKTLIVKGERCVCVWHCQCVCHNYPRPGLGCKPLTLKEYNRAGFPGHLPGEVSGITCDVFFCVIQALILFFLSLLLLGLVKAVLGLCFPSIGAWQLCYIMPDEARCHKFYFEPDLACKPSVYNCSGCPVNPYTFKQTVCFLPWCTEFVANVFFFIQVARICVCNWLLRKTFFINRYQYFQGRGLYSPMRCGGRSPCAHGQPCASYDNMGRTHLVAGGEVKDPQKLTELANAQDTLRSKSAMNPHLKRKLSYAYLHHR